ncbi:MULTISPECIES: agarase [Sphingomonas]|jgi:hypothetical protein|nr:agarase [Sphingomonas turrisvirgatae]
MVRFWITPLALSQALLLAGCYEESGSGETRTADVMTMVAAPPQAAPLAVNVSINVNADVRHVVGGVSSFSREKFINIHAINSDLEWWGGNAQSLNQPQEVPDLLNGFVKNLDVYFGRDSGSMAYELTRVPQGSQPGYADANAMASLSALPRTYGYHTAAQRTVVGSAEFEKRMASWVLVAQERPFFPNGYPIANQGWAFSRTDTQAAPFGSSTGHFIGNYLARYFNQSGSVGAGAGIIKPKFVEAINEPLYTLIDDPAPHLAGYPRPTYNDVFRYHDGVRNQVRPLNTARQVQVGGYTPAFPDFEEAEPSNAALFARWNARDGAWLGGAGRNMDFVSLHLYDFEGIPKNGNVYKQYRKGSNVEATFDMLDYAMNWAYGGQLKPLVISEYGARAHQVEPNAWTPQRDWFYLKAMNSLMLQFMERPDRIAKAIPFVVLKGEWGRTSVPYNWRLLRQAFEDGTPANAGNGTWVYTEMVNFYRLWNGVKGTRLESWAADRDFLVDAYVDGAAKDLYVIINSLESTPRTVDLKLLGIPAGSTVTQVEQRHLYPDANGRPILSTSTSASVPGSVVLGSEATMVLRIRYSTAPAQPHTLSQSRHYATVGSSTVLTNIVAGSTHNFTVPNVTPGANGEAVLRLGVGREHGKSLQPVITFNGVTLSVPTDYRGYDQYNGGKGRSRFFGVLEIPVPLSALRASNNIGVRFPDSGGAISSVVLDNSVSTRSLARQ